MESVACFLTKTRFSIISSNSLSVHQTSASMARGNLTLPICFFKIILQTNLQTIKIPNKFTRSHGVGLPNPMFIKPPDGTAWKVFWKNINGEIWFQKGWKTFTQNYSLQHGCLVVFKYKEGSSELDVIILGLHAVEIDYDDSSCDTLDETDNLDDSDDESVEILNEWLNRKKLRQKSPLISLRPYKKVRGGIEKNSQRTTSLNRPKESRAQEVAEEFISNNPFFTILIKPANLAANRLSVPILKGVIENKKTNVMLQIGERSWNLKLLPCYNGKKERRLSAGWSLFARESGLQPGDRVPDFNGVIENKNKNAKLQVGEISWNLKLLRSYGDKTDRRFSAGWSMFVRKSGLKVGDVCVFELINKEDLVFKVHIF